MILQTFADLFGAFSLTKGFFERLGHFFGFFAVTPSTWPGESKRPPPHRSLLRVLRRKEKRSFAVCGCGPPKEGSV